MKATQGKKSEIRGDASGQFARRRKGGDKDGLHNAKPVVVTGKRDATFGTKAMKPKKKQS